MSLSFIATNIKQRQLQFFFGFDHMTLNATVQLFWSWHAIIHRCNSLIVLIMACNNSFVIYHLSLLSQFCYMQNQISRFSICKTRNLISFKHIKFHKSKTKIYYRKILNLIQLRMTKYSNFEPQVINKSTNGLKLT